MFPAVAMLTTAAPQLLDGDLSLIQSKPNILPYLLWLISYTQPLNPRHAPPHSLPNQLNEHINVVFLPSVYDQPAK